MNSLRGTSSFGGLSIVIPLPTVDSYKSRLPSVITADGQHNFNHRTGIWFNPSIGRGRSAKYFDIPDARIGYILRGGSSFSCSNEDTTFTIKGFNITDELLILQACSEGRVEYVWYDGEWMDQFDLMSAMTSREYNMESREIPGYDIDLDPELERIRSIQFACGWI